MLILDSFDLIVCFSLPLPPGLSLNLFCVFVLFGGFWEEDGFCFEHFSSPQEQ